MGARAALELLAPAVLGVDPTNLSAINHAMDSVLMGHNYAKSPVDVACWDIHGKVADMSVTTLLGGLRMAEFPLYKAVPFDVPEVMLREHSKHINPSTEFL